MGSFYANISVRTMNQAAVADALRQQARIAYVLPPNKGYVVVCDAECDEQDITVITSLARSLSAQFACIAFAALNHDEDLLWVQVFVDGTLMDEYVSTPGFFDADAARGPIGGSAAVLSTIFDRPGEASTIDKILHKTQYVLANQRHTALAQALGLPSRYAQLGYQELKTADERIDENSDTVRLPNKAWLRQFVQSEDIARPFVLLKEVRRLIRQHRKISAMDLYRRYTGCTLEEARDYIESL